MSGDKRKAFGTSIVTTVTTVTSRFVYVREVVFYRVLGTDRGHWCQLVTAKKRLPESDFPNPTRNAARRPIDARTSLLRLQTGISHQGPGAHGESILGRLAPAESIKPTVIARRLEQAA